MLLRKVDEVDHREAFGKQELSLVGDPDVGSNWLAGRQAGRLHRLMERGHHKSRCLGEELDGGPF